MEEKENLEVQEKVEQQTDTAEETQVQTEGNVEVSENANVTEEVSENVEMTDGQSGEEKSEEAAIEKTEIEPKKEKVKKEKKVKAPKPEKVKPVKVEKPKKKTAAEKKAEKEAAREAEYAGLSDDELYAKIQTEKLLKRKKKNKIVTLISLCFAFVLVVSVIVMAAVPVSLKPKCLESGFTEVRIYPGTTTSQAHFSEGSDAFDKFMDVYDEAFKQTYINALFTGTLFDYEIEEKYAAVPSVSNLTNNDTYVVMLKYDEDQVFTYQNGKAYDSVYETKNWENSKLTFREVYFTLSQEEGMQTTTVYIAINNYPDSSSNTGYKTSNNLIKITTKGNTKLIYDAYEELYDLAQA